MPHVHPVQLDPEEDGGYVVTLPDIGYGATQGDTLEEALLQAEDMLAEAVLGMIAHNEEVPAPSPAKGRPVAQLPALTEEAHRHPVQASLPGHVETWLGSRAPATSSSYPSRLLEIVSQNHVDARLPSRSGGPEPLDDIRIEAQRDQLLRRL
jgi:predicted RNase H-like HicB family nuclease